MRTIIAGSRTLGFSDVEHAMQACPWKPTVVISGGARGVDLAGENWARANSIPVERYPADWNRLGKGAGFNRNIKMAKNADALVAVWDGRSRGTQHMIGMARAHGLRIYVHTHQTGTFRVEG